MPKAIHQTHKKMWNKDHIFLFARILTVPMNLFFNEPDDSRLAEVEVMIAGMILDNFTEGPVIASNDYGRNSQ